jgi:hypothetical protein
MAVIHDAVLRPSKLESIAGWLPAQAWSGARDDSEVVLAGRFRFDDPDGEVGIEIMLVRVDGGPVLHVPLTYRGAPLDGAAEFLVSEMHHSVLGQRWAYDATADPVYADVLRRTILTGAHEAELELASGDGTQEKEGTAHGSGTLDDTSRTTTATPITTGSVTTITTELGDVVVLRAPELTTAEIGETLVAEWGDDSSAVLAVVPEGAGSKA